METSISSGLLLILGILVLIGMLAVLRFLLVPPRCPRCGSNLQWKQFVGPDFRDRRSRVCAQCGYTQVVSPVQWSFGPRFQSGWCPKCRTRLEFSGRTETFIAGDEIGSNFIEIWTCPKCGYRDKREKHVDTSMLGIFLGAALRSLRSHRLL